MAPVLGYRTTALQALRGVDLTGKTAVVTGSMHASASAASPTECFCRVLFCMFCWKICLARKGGNSGIGVETARALAHAGAKVILTSRKVSAGKDVVTKLQADGSKARLVSTCCFELCQCRVCCCKSCKCFTSCQTGCLRAAFMFSS